ncbi:hypothetical protein B0H10DRAFT_2016307 [Mycena sp. CBHHK59/15]|nr:hypothetical protein B0H10DRAFT_2016307 [Mycena sp. CBHHK59/15]
MQMPRDFRFGQPRSLCIRSMSEKVADQLAGVKQLLVEQAEDCAQHRIYMDERRAITEQQRAESDAIEARVRADLARVMDMQKERLNIPAKPESDDNDVFDALVELVKQNRDSRMTDLKDFIQNCKMLRDQQRAELLQKISSLEKNA